MCCGKRRKIDTSGRSDVPQVISRPSVSATPRPPYICETCWAGLFKSGLLHTTIGPSKGQPRSGGFAYTTSWQELADRAAQGCRWCALLLVTRELDEDEEDSDSSTPFNVIVGTQKCLGSSQPKNAQDLSVFINDILHFIGYLYTDDDDPAAPYITARPRILNISSSDALSLAKRCIQECIETHERCGHLHEPVLPTRVIDCSNPSNPRLAETKGTRGAYVALSYVWGEPQPHSTTTLNVSAYLSSINSTCLPQTIRDAIDVTHRLGLRYLWADTLCIIQDSDEDKAREISRMRFIYRDAYITIIVSSARRVGEGFLQTRPPVCLPRDDDVLVLPFVLPGGASPGVGSMHVCPIWMYSDSVDKPEARYDPAMEPINTRGWCMQERLLSRRALVFASHTLQYHCQTAEQNIGKAYHDPMERLQLPDACLRVDTTHFSPPSAEWLAAREQWRITVSDYTRRSISVPADKLTAFGGIAEEYSHLWQTPYLAGLWRASLLGDLLWSKRSDGHMVRPKKYRAPSWSWAAVDGRVEAGAIQVQADERKKVVDVIQCNVTLKDARLPFGEVTGGILVLRAPLVKCMWNIEEPNYVYLVNSSTMPSQEKLALADDDDEVELETNCIGIGYIDSKDDAHVQGVWVVPLHWNNAITAGLIVTSSNQESDFEGKYYRRIGMFNTHAKAGPVDWLDNEPFVDVCLV